MATRINLSRKKWLYKKNYITQQKFGLLFCVLSVSIFTHAQNAYWPNQSMNMVYNASYKQNIGKGHSKTVLSLFQNADRNRDKKISREELQWYQDMLVRTFAYKNNELALTPDQFINQGGGDCEDFAIMTCCMLNYHGVIAYIANFGRVTVNKHSLRMVKITKPVPPGFLYYELDYVVPKGIYIPVDYDTIGGLEAIDRRWKIASMSIPKEMYGKYW